MKQALSSVHQAWRALPRLLQVLYFLIILGTLFRLMFVVFQNPLDFLFSDPKRHWVNAERFFNPKLMNGLDPIVYQCYLYLLAKLTFGNKLLIGISTGILSALTPWTYYLAARRLHIDKKNSLLLWACIAWMPSLWVIYRYFMIETILLPLIGISLWATGTALQKKSISSVALMSLCWTIACLTKLQAIPLALICLGFVLFKMERKWTALIVQLVIAALFITPNAIHSKAILGFPAPFGNSIIPQFEHRSGARSVRFHWNKETVIFSSPSCYIMPLYPLNSWTILRAYDDTIYEAWIDKNLGKKGWTSKLEKIDWPWERRIQQLFENSVLFIFAPSWPDSGQDTWVGTINYWGRWVWSLLIFYILYGNWNFFKKLQISLIPLATTGLLLALLFQNSVTMEGRYRKPVEALLLLNTAFLISYSNQRKTNVTISKNHS